MGRIYGRTNDLKMLERYATEEPVENKAFFGVRGLGKTSLFEAFFTRQKIQELAEEQKYLFVRAELSKRKTGEDLYAFLIDAVVRGIRSIPDKNVQKDMMEEKKQADLDYETAERRLGEYLEIISMWGYSFVLVLDHFHCLGRATDVDKEQYDLLRSFSENNRMKFWIISDSDFSDMYATSQFTTSFFAQNFVPKTLGQIDGESALALLEKRLESREGAALTEEEKKMVYLLTGGIPGLLIKGLDCLLSLKEEQEGVTKDELLEGMLEDNSCTSFMNSWCRGLTKAQKELLLIIAQKGHVTSQGISGQITVMNALSNKTGLGLVHTIQTEDVKFWRMNSELLRQYILRKGEDFCTSEIAPEKDADGGILENLPQGAVVTIHNYHGTYIGQQSNQVIQNTINIGDAVTGLEDLKRMMNQNFLLPDAEKASGALRQLPFQQEVWEELSEEEQEESLNEFADQMFSSEDFVSGSLKADQMHRFFLTEEVLGELTDDCRKQIVCGIQVYDLIQICMERLNLDLRESESPRGILFSRALERHLKDWAVPLFRSIPDIANTHIKIGSAFNGAFKNCTNRHIGKTTIGTYTTMLNNANIQTLAGRCMFGGYQSCNVQWWNARKEKLLKIQGLRNDCCHSGTAFNNRKLKEMITCIFEQDTISDILMFKKLTV